MAAPGITLVHRFPYRDNPDEEFSNTYHFVGSAPSDAAGWLALANALVNLEKLCLSNNVRYARAYGYANTDDDAVWSKDWVTDGGGATGSLSVTGQNLAPGDAAAWVRWKTARTNSKGKPIYLRKYFHSIRLSWDGTDWDTIETTQHTALLAFGTSVNAASGSWPGIAGPDGVAPGVRAASTYVTTRTLKRRGKRPS